MLLILFWQPVSTPHSIVIHYQVLQYGNYIGPYRTLKQPWFKILVTENSGSNVSFLERKLLLLICLLTAGTTFNHFLFWHSLQHCFTETKCSTKYGGVEPLGTYFKISCSQHWKVVQCHVFYDASCSLVNLQHCKKA